MDLSGRVIFVTVISVHMLQDKSLGKARRFNWWCSLWWSATVTTSEVRI